MESFLRQNREKQVWRDMFFFQQFRRNFEFGSNKQPRFQLKYVDFDQASGQSKLNLHKLSL